MNGMISSLTTVACAAAALGMTACDKVKDLAESAKSWVSDDAEEATNSKGKTTDIQSVDKQKGEEVISSESRLVIVEYYSDT